MRNHRRPGREAPVTKLTQSGFMKWLVPPIRAEAAALLPPPLERAPAADDPFAAIGKEVGAAKAQLDTIAPADFNQLMYALDLYAGLKRTMRAEYSMTITTNAALKMYEMLGQLRLLPRGADCASAPRARVFCNAELPGAFIVAINHFIRTTCPETNFDWVASSYLPAAAAAEAGAETTILDDQYGLYASNRGQWLMGAPPNAMPAGEPPVSGDVTSADVVAALADAVHARWSADDGSGGASLYTSDAGIDISSDYAREEELTSLLNYGQVLCGVLALARGGALVTKQFMFVHPFTRSLIALLAALFDELYVVKPLTSRPGNSEVYLVGKGFRGITPAHADALLDRLAAYRAAPDTTPCDWTPLLEPTLYADADAALLRVARQVHGRQQVAFLNEAMSLYGQFRGRLDQLARALAADARRVQEAWLAENPVRRIRDGAQLPARRDSEAKSRGGEAKSRNSEVSPHNGSGRRPRVRIVARRLSAGLRLDAEVLRGVLAATCEVSIIEAGGGDTPLPAVDVQFHLEHFIEGCPARTNYLVVNQEFLFDWDLVALTTGRVAALCKTEYACRVLRDSFGLDPLRVGFTTPPYVAPLDGQHDARLVAHLAGTSGLKGTLTVLRAWVEHGGLDLSATLFITRQPADFARAPADLAYWDKLAPDTGATFLGIVGLERHKNIYLARRVLNATEFARVATAAMTQLCPSATEGFGHIINGARAAGAVAIVLDAPPMNELVDASCGFLVRAAPGPTMAALNPTQCKNYPPAIAALETHVADPAALMAATVRALALEEEDRACLGRAARDRFADERARFTAALVALVGTA